MRDKEKFISRYTRSFHHGQFLGMFHNNMVLPVWIHKKAVH